MARVDVGTVIFKTEFNKDLWFTDNARAGNYFFDSRETAAHYGRLTAAARYALGYRTDLS